MTKSGKLKASLNIGPLHSLNDLDISHIQLEILKWYYLNQRNLPWRTIAKSENDRNKRSYAVWVSEIMLQQTQVATVIKYFEKWMMTWPTVQSLAESNLEEVNKVWAGLGYYSRAKRLHEGAIKIRDEMSGQFPLESTALQKELPGVGRYTASAIASIAMNEPVGVVDGNVIRVLTRLRVIGADITSQQVMDELWKLMNKCVDTKSPGDFNQAFMELGATVCTPKDPQCSKCPLKQVCLSYKFFRGSSPKRSGSLKKEECDFPIPDIECIPNCDLCLKKEDWNPSLNVQNFPRKGRKTRVTVMTSAVVVFQNVSESSDGDYLCIQRPNSGLLANLWEFPTVVLQEIVENEDEKSITEKVKSELCATFRVDQKLIKNMKHVKDVVHIFSHIHQTYKVYHLKLDGEVSIELPRSYQGLRWMSREEFQSSATSTAMKKVLSSLDVTVSNKKSGLNRGSVKDLRETKQQKLSAYFKTNAEISSSK